MTLEQHIERAVRELRTRLQEYEALRAFNLKIEASGRVHDGEVKVEFNLSEYAYGEGPKGCSLANVEEEFVRRWAWNKRNAPLSLSFDGK